jgi:O-antigen ligase
MMQAWLWTFCGIVFIAALWQVQFVLSTPDPFVDPDVTQRYFRFGWGTFAASNYFAAMLLLFLPAVVYRLTVPAYGRAVRRWPVFLLLVVFGTALVFTFSRGALAAVLVSLALTVAMPVRGRGRRVAVLAGVIGAAVAVVVTTPAAARVVDFAGRSVDEIANQRGDIWREALWAAGTHPVIGVGLGGLLTAQEGRTYAHNLVLQLAAETGALGTLSFLLFLATMGWVLVRVSLAESRSPDVWIYFGLLTSFVATLMHNAVENTLIGGVLFNFIFWPLQALALARYWSLLGLEPGMAPAGEPAALPGGADPELPATATS